MTGSATKAGGSWKITSVNIEGSKVRFAVEGERSFVFDAPRSDDAINDQGADIMDELPSTSVEGGADGWTVKFEETLTVSLGRTPEDTVRAMLMEMDDITDDIATAWNKAQGELDDLLKDYEEDLDESDPRSDRLT